MTEMLQKTENVAKNVANENSQDLTEQWKKGELSEGHYYVKDGENMIAEYLDGYFYNNGNPMTSFTGGVDEVLAPVPSYDEWQDLKSKLQLKETAYDFDTARLEEENAQLKELLKECELWFTGMVGNMNDKNVGEHNKSVPIGNFEYIFKEFSQKIKGALK